MTVVFKALATSIFLTLLVANSSFAQTKKDKNDPYQTKLYWSLHDTPMQQRLRSLSPFPVCVVYYSQLNDDLSSAVKEFQLIKSTGFNSLKQLALKNKLSGKEMEKKTFHAALDNQVYPWYYGMGGWDPITPELVKKLGIKLKVNEENMRAIQEHPAMIKYQTDMLHKRVDNMHSIPPIPAHIKMGEPGRSFPYLTERQVPLFADWLKDKYKNLEVLNKNWHSAYTDGEAFTNFDDAAKSLLANKTDQFGNRDGNRTWDFRRLRDAMRYQADQAVGDYQRSMAHYIKYEPNEPKRTGGHQLFENQAINGWDIEGQAAAAAVGGSFYSSIHMAHHFFLNEGEVTRPVYMQARLIADNFKGGWAATWESTGGPTQWSGTHSFTIDGATMSRLMYSYVAAGLKGIGFWTWNSREVGWEAGEYALTDLQGQPSERAVVAAQIAKGLDKHRFELWKALDEPTVGILYSWENEATLARMSLGTYPLPTRAYPKDRAAEMQQYYSQSRVGISRALMNNNVPYEYLTENDAKKGLLDRYKIIYLPYMLTISSEIIPLLDEYVKNGGRIVADMPLMMYDEKGVLNKYPKGGSFDQLFGFQIADFQTNFNQQQTWKGFEPTGQWADIKVNSAQVVAKFESGKPAILKHNKGKGSTLVFNFEASRQFFNKGDAKFESAVVKELLGEIKPAFTASNNALVYRRSAPTADHYFIINDKDEEVSVSITPTEGQKYKSAEEGINGDKVSVSNNTIQVKVPAGMGFWVRAVK